MDKENIEEMVRDFCSVTPKSKSEVRRRINGSIAQAIAEERSKAWEVEAVKQAYIQGKSQALAEERERVVEKIREIVIKIIHDLIIGERSSRTYKNYCGQDWVAETYIEKQLVNSVYNHLESVIKDYPLLSSLNITKTDI